MALPAPVTPPRKALSIPVHRGNNRVSQFLGATVTPGADASNQPLAQTHQLVLPIPAGQTVRIPIPGISYYFEFLGTPGGVPNNFAGLTVTAINAGQPRTKIIHVQGTGLRFGTQPFNSLEILNNDPAHNALFTIDIGGGVPNQSYDEYIDKRVIISTAGTSSIISVSTAVGVALGVENALTTNVAFKTRTPAWADVLAGGATQDIAGGYTGLNRFSITISNDDAAQVLTVLDSAGNIFASIQPATAWYQQSSDDFKLHNPGAGNVTCHIGEVYYNY